MACTLFADDPVSSKAYAVFGARVDHFLDARGLCCWSELDVAEFLYEAAGDAPEAVTLCCMLCTAIPWLVGAEDISAAQGDALMRRILEVCPEDAEAETFMRNVAASVPQSALPIETWH